MPVIGRALLVPFLMFDAVGGWTKGMEGHTIVSHSIKVETLEIGKQERVLLKVPSSIAYR